MVSRLDNTPFLSLLPGSISADPTIRASAASLDGVLRELTLSIPHVLLYARLLLTAGYPLSGNYLPAIARIIQARGGLKPLSTAELELLAWQLHVDFREVARNDRQLAEMIVLSIPWHRKKGTPASVERALALFGYVAETEEDGAGDRWACYQLDLKNVLAPADIQKTFAVAREMAPVRCRLWRVYNSELDIRPLRLSLGPGLSRGALSAWSGVPVLDESDPKQEDVLVSLGVRLRMGSLPHSHSAGIMVRSGLCFMARRLRAFHLSLSRLSVEKFPARHGFMFGINLTLGEGRARPHVVPRNFAFSKSQCVLSESWAGLGKENCRLSMPFDRYLTKPFALSRARLSTHDVGYVCAPIHEITQGLHRGGLAPRERPQAGGAVVTCVHISAETSRATDHETWPQSACDRRWWPHVAHTSITKETV